MYYYSNCRKKSVTQVLTNFPVNRLGSNFVVVVSREVMAVVMEVVSSVFTAVLYLRTQQNASLRNTIYWSLQVLFCRRESKYKTHSVPWRYEICYSNALCKCCLIDLLDREVEDKNIQGKHKFFPWLQIFITRKLRGI